MKITSSIKCLLLCLVSAQAVDDSKNLRSSDQSARRTEVEITPEELATFQAVMNKGLSDLVSSTADQFARRTEEKSFFGGAWDSAKHMVSGVFDCDPYKYGMEGVLTAFLDSGVQSVSDLSTADIERSMALMTTAFADAGSIPGTYPTWTVDFISATYEGFRSRNTATNSIRWDADLNLLMEGAHFPSERDMNALLVGAFGTIVGDAMKTAWPSDKIWGSMLDNTLAYSCSERDDRCPN